MRVARLTLNARIEPHHRPRLGVLGILGALQREQRAEYMRAVEVHDLIKGRGGGRVRVRVGVAVGVAVG